MKRVLKVVPVIVGLITTSILLLVSCSSNESMEVDEAELTETNVVSTETSSETNNELIGTWTVKGVSIDGNVYDASKLGGIYDGEFLSIKENGTFDFCEVLFWMSGRCVPMQDRDGEKSYLLMTERVYQVELQDGELEEKDVEWTKEYPAYYITLHAGTDENTLFFVEYDPIMKAMKKDSTPLMLVKAGSE